MGSSSDNVVTFWCSVVSVVARELLFRRADDTESGSIQTLTVTKTATVTDTKTATITATSTETVTSNATDTETKSDAATKSDAETKTDTAKDKDAFDLLGLPVGNSSGVTAGTATIGNTTATNTTWTVEVVWYNSTKCTTPVGITYLNSADAQGEDPSKTAQSIEILMTNRKVDGSGHRVALKKGREARTSTDWGTRRATVIMRKKYMCRGSSWLAMMLLVSREQWLCRDH